MSEGRLEVKIFACVEYAYFLTQTGNGFRSSQPVTMSEWMKKSPLEWEDYVYKEVRVVASEKKEYKGWLLTTDPVSAKWVCTLFLEVTTPGTA